MLLTRWHKAHFVKAIKGLVALQVFNVLAIPYMHYVGQEWKSWMKQFRSWYCFNTWWSIQVTRKNDLLSVDKLPRSVKTWDNHVRLTFLRLETKMATLTAGDPFLQCIARVKNKPMFLLFMAELTITVLQHNFFYLFDSHSRNMHGLCVADGTSVLIKFGSLLEIEHYIQVEY